MKKSLFLLSVVLLLWSCASDEPALPSGPMPIVVEGWIEEDMTPVVIVTRAVDLTSEASSFDGFVEKWARVSIYDNGRQYLLSGRVNSDYATSFVYTSSRLHGKAGHTYRLVVETETDTVESTVTMLTSPKITKIEAVPVEGCDTLFSIRAFVDDVAPEGYYKFFSKTDGLEKRFFGTFLGTFGGKDYIGAEGYAITRGVHSAYDESNTFSHYYSAGSTVIVKIAAIERPLYDFWKVVDSNMSLSGNLLFSFSENCPSNIQGGLGYWAAYAPSVRVVHIPDNK